MLPPQDISAHLPHPLLALSTLHICWLLCSSKQLVLFVLGDFPYLLPHFQEAYNSVFQPFYCSLFKLKPLIRPLLFSLLFQLLLPSCPTPPLLFQAAIKFKSIFSEEKS